MVSTCGCDRGDVLTVSVRRFGQAFSARPGGARQLDRRISLLYKTNRMDYPTTAVERR